MGLAHLAIILTGVYRLLTVRGAAAGTAAVGDAGSGALPDAVSGAETGG